MAPTLPAPPRWHPGALRLPKSNPLPGSLSGAGNAAEFRWNFEVEKHLGREEKKGRGKKEYRGQRQGKDLKGSTMLTVETAQETVGAREVCEPVTSQE